MTTECEMIQALLSAYMDGECSPEEMRAVEQHVSDCEECRCFLNTLQENAALVGGSSTPFRKELHEGIMQAVRETEQAKKPFQFGKWVQYLSTAAACVTLVLLVGLAARFSEPKPVMKLGLEPRPQSVSLYEREDGSLSNAATNTEDGVAATLIFDDASVVMTLDEKTMTGRAVLDEEGRPIRLIFDQVSFSVSFVGEDQWILQEE